VYVARQRLGENVTAAKNTHATTELLDASFLCGPCRIKGKSRRLVLTRTSYFTLGIIFYTEEAGKRFLRNVGRHPTTRCRVPESSTLYVHYALKGRRFSPPAEPRTLPSCVNFHTMLIIFTSTCYINTTFTRRQFPRGLLGSCARI
jgi:hypothetical protein